MDFYFYDPIKHCVQWSGTDIAILKLNTKVNFILNNEKNAIMPACLPNRRVHNNVYNQEVYTAGIRYGTFLQQLKCGCRFSALIHVWIASAGV